MIRHFKIIVVLILWMAIPLAHAQDKVLNDSISKLKRPERLKWITEYIAANPSSVSGPYFLSEFLKFDYQTPMEQQEELIGKFTGAAKQTKTYLAMAAVLQKKRRLKPGNTAPDFTLMQDNGKKLKLAEMRGKYVLIDFWASWCVPCRKAIPHLKTVYAKYKSKGFEIISLSADQNKEAWKKALEQEKMPWLQVVDEFPEKFAPSVVGNLYEVKFLPFYVLLDTAGKILVYSGNEQEAEAQLEKLLGGR